MNIYIVECNKHQLQSLKRSVYGNSETMMEKVVDCDTYLFIHQHPYTPDDNNSVTCVQLCPSNIHEGGKVHSVQFKASSACK